MNRENNMKDIVFEKKNKRCTHLIYDGYISAFESDERTFYEGREQLIKWIDRHKRTAEIGIPLEGREKRVTVGVEIYEKQV